MAMTQEDLNAEIRKIRRACVVVLEGSGGNRERKLADEILDTIAMYRQSRRHSRRHDLNGDWDTEPTWVRPELED